MPWGGGSGDPQEQPALAAAAKPGQEGPALGWRRVGSSVAFPAAEPPAPPLQTPPARKVGETHLEGARARLGFYQTERGLAGAKAGPLPRPPGGIGLFEAAPGTLGVERPSRRPMAQFPALSAQREGEGGRVPTCQPQINSSCGLARPAAGPQHLGEIQEKAGETSDPEWDTSPPPLARAPLALLFQPQPTNWPPACARPPPTDPRPSTSGPLTRAIRVGILLRGGGR